MTIVVLPRIEIDNPFSELAEVLKNEAIPMIRQLAMNKEQIAILSDTELTDHIPILKRFAPELLTQDGKIDWNKVEEYLQSDDLFKKEVANYLINTRRRREEFRNLPIGAKLEQLDFYGAKTNPEILKKEFMRYTILNKYQEAIEKANLPEDAKLFLLAHAPQFAELTVKNPAYFNAFINILAKHSKKQEETKQEGETGGWRLSLDEEGQRKFGIRLEEPKLTPPQITPPQVPKVAGQRPVVRQGGGEVVKQDVKAQQRQQPQQANQQIPQNLPFDSNYKPRSTGLLSAPDLFDLLTFGAGVGAGWLASKFGGKIVGGIARKADEVVGRVFGKKGVENVVGKEAQKVIETTTKKEAQNVASNQAQNVVRQAEKSKYDIRREELAKRIKEEMKRNRGDWVFAEKPKQVNPEEVRALIKEAMKKEQESKLPVLAPKETRWEFANARPPAIVKEMLDNHPKFERIISERAVRESKEVAQQLKDFLKKRTTPELSKDITLEPYKRIIKLVEKAPENLKKTSQFKELIKEMIKEAERIQKEASKGKDVSTDLMKLYEKISRLEELLETPVSKTKRSPKPKKKKI